MSTTRKYFELAAAEFDVPIVLLMVIGQVENNWVQVGPTLNQGWGIMHLVENSYCNTLEEAAQLLGVTKQILKDDAQQNIRGAAALLAKYAGKKRHSRIRLENWFSAAAQFSGLGDPDLRNRQAENYFEVMRNGVTAKTVWGEEITIEAQEIAKKKYQDWKY